MPTVLSTKKLELNQKELLLNSGIALVEYDAISIDFMEFNLHSSRVEHAIFTSQNALRAIKSSGLRFTNCYCVGEKTSRMAKSMGFHVVACRNYAEELAMEIVKNHAHHSFQFFSGTSRRDTLPDILKNHGIELKETNVYQTSLNIQQFHSKFDGIMFYSPSGVQSHTTRNTINATAFCIGETTAAEAKKNTTQIVIPGTPGIENLIAAVAKTFRKN